MIAATVVLLFELVVLFVGVSFAVEVLQRRIGPVRLRSWMGGRPVPAALKGIAVGFVTPFCTYSAVPLLVGLRRAGVRPAGYVAFISAAPVLDPILFGALVLIVGVEVALLYVAVTFTAALCFALAAERLGVERYLRPVEAPAQPALAAMPRPTTKEMGSVVVAPPPESSGPVDRWQGWPAERRLALAASLRLLRSFGPLLLLGVAIGLAMEAAISPGTAARWTTGNPLIAIPTASAFGTPLYINTELFVPIANSLHRAGVGVGAIVALTIAGAGANLPEFVVLSKMARPGAITVFFCYVFAVAMTGGFLAHLTAGG